MERKVLLIRRIIYIILFILSLVFISFRGGNLPYMLFFMMVINTVLSYAHILYVFCSIKIFQIIPETGTTKRETVPYHLKLSNEGFIACGTITLHFMKGLSEVKEMEGMGSISLEPGQGMDFYSEILCNYSGTYFVGVDTVEIMDYFKIFRIRFHMPQKARVTVKPRIQNLDYIDFVMENEECRSSGQRGKSGYQIDNEVRKYAPSDNRKLIHWKNSAKRQELMVRNLAEEEISEYAVILDVKIAESDYESRIILCDKLRETMVALVYYIHCSGYHVLSVLDSSFQKEIHSMEDFGELYSRITKYGFEKKEELEGLLPALNRELQEGMPFVVISSNPEEISQGIWDEIRVFRNIHIVDVNLLDVDEMDFQNFKE